MTLYSLSLGLVLIAGAPWWLGRMLTSGRYRAGLAGRLGRVPPDLRERVRGRDVIWLHAVSVGEVVAATGLVRELERALPGWVVAVSTTTATGQAVARQRFPGLPVFYYPLDLGYPVRRYLRVLRPRMIVLMESELWPRMLVEAERARVPVAVANARASDRSLRRTLALPSALRQAWAGLLGKVTLFLAGGEETAARLLRLGVREQDVHVTGNLKFDLADPAETAMMLRIAASLPPDAPVLVCGSTLDGEERLLLQAWPAVLRQLPEAVMILAPRHPQRFAAVARLAESLGLRTVRASGLAESGARLGHGSVLLLDTVGDLAAVYSLATAAFLGGSLVDAGGHNPLEAARFGVPVLMGPSRGNFREITATLEAGGGLLGVTAADLPRILPRMLGGSEEARALGERGRAVFEAQAGATGRTVAALLRLLEAEPVQ